MTEKLWSIYVEQSQQRRSFVLFITTWTVALGQQIKFYKLLSSQMSSGTYRWLAWSSCTCASVLTTFVSKYVADKQKNQLHLLLCLCSKDINVLYVVHKCKLSSEKAAFNSTSMDTKHFQTVSILLYNKQLSKQLQDIK